MLFKLVTIFTIFQLITASIPDPITKIAHKEGDKYGSVQITYPAGSLGEYAGTLFFTTILNGPVWTQYEYVSNDTNTGLSDNLSQRYYTIDSKVESTGAWYYHGDSEKDVTLSLYFASNKDNYENFTTNFFGTYVDHRFRGTTNNPFNSTARFESS
ncbi:putative secreted protein [Wickerhamomyces ciferrii]|uniref:Secreted protein n=1 Tax=Wickerhamomyces ciferrii (strain ATCC 14091 / BCRC 22168 / CBS 111 / JCM 3599 / NBRC 0793 / NRRL Y-1031 F-60-10) TaxID=1206466 RepID=K0KW98_WICCF|nr:uncharacterized protein BN7_5838 [Wickerhamomyces ciferrii]CCH46247.1 putative secreted protein [Wickerhamomyces ciferrii]